MSKVDYTTMTDQELKLYILDHREDQEAFHAYMDRRYARSNREAISPDDPEWKSKALSNIKKQLHQIK